MASINNVDLNIVRDVANGEVTIEFDVNWSSFDQATNLPYLVSWTLIGDDTDIFGDLGLLGPDDAIPMGLMPLLRLSSNGNASTHYSNADNPKTIAWADLDEDPQTWANPDEIRAVVTVSPLLPTTVSKESNLVEVTI